MRVVAAAAVVLLAFAGSAQAMEWRLGLSYASGVSDVADLYEDNLRLAGRDVNVDLKFPLGIAASFIYDWTSEWRTDVGVGPVFAIGGDVKHMEVPLSATMGYNFLPYSRYSPYVRGGVIHHFASGDQYRQLDARAVPGRRRGLHALHAGARHRPIEGRVRSPELSGGRQLHARHDGAEHVRRSREFLLAFPARIAEGATPGRSCTVNIPQSGHRWLAAIAFAVLTACSNGRGSVSDPASGPVGEPPPPPPVPPPASAAA